MRTEVPKSLVFEGSHLRMWYEETLKLNQTRTAIAIEGSPAGFLSLANVLLYFVYGWKEQIVISSFPFITSSINLTIENDISELPFNGPRPVGEIKRIADADFIWNVCEEDLLTFAFNVHSLALINMEIHWHDKLDKDAISVYCVWEEGTQRPELVGL